MAFIRGVTTTAPSTPVKTTRTAVKAGTPPRLSDRLMATGAVTDLGASEISTVRGRPSAAPTAMAETIDVAVPAINAASIGSALRRTVGQFLYRGMAMATVVGPSRKWMNCAPVK